MVVAKMAGAFEYRCVVATPADESWQLLYDLLVRDGALSDGAFRLISAVNISGPSPAYEELVGRLRAIARLGWVKTVRSGDTGVGMTLEHLLGLAPNSRKDPDYRGIELKAKRVRGKGTGRQTLFAKTPDWNEGGRVALLDEHGSLDGNGRFSIYQSIDAHRKSKEGWRLVYDPGDERLWVTRHGERIVSWRRSVLAKSLETKHRETVFIYAETRGKAAAEEFRFTHALHATGADVERLLRVLNDGAGCHDFAIHRRPDGSVRDHGFLFRVEEIALPEVFREVESYDLLGPERITASEDGDEQELVER